MRKYWAFYTLGLENALAYRGPMFFWLAGNVISMFVMISVWLAADSSGKMGSFTKNELITYYIVALGLEWFVSWYPFNWIREEIKNGEIIGNSLVKPVSYFTRAFSAEASWHSISVFLGLGVAFVFYLIFQENFVGMAQPSQIPALVFATILAALLTFSFSLCLGLLTFWFVETEMLFDVYWALLALFGGQLLPLTFLPPILQKLSEILPFRYMLSFPLEIYFGKANQAELSTGFIAQFMWLATFVGLYKILWARGVKKYEAWGH